MIWPGIALVAAALAAAPPPAGTGHAFAESIAREGPRPAASVRERRAQVRVRRAFGAAGLRLGSDAFAVPGRGRSRNVIGIHDTPAACLHVLMAHADSMPRTPGAQDNASGLGALVELAPRLARIEPRCDVWLVATGAEERLYTGRPDHLGATALVRRVAKLGRRDDLELALSLDEVGRGAEMALRSPVPRRRRRVEDAVIGAARGTGLRVRWRRDVGEGNSDHREFELAGLPAAKLGVPANPCRHEPCDTAGTLTTSTFTKVRRLLERLLA